METKCAYISVRCRALDIRKFPDCYPAQLGLSHLGTFDAEKLCRVGVRSDPEFAFIGSGGGGLRKPTALSVTDAPCQCGSLERDARDPGFPVRYDAEWNDYYLDLTLSKGTKLSLIIYHCPMCGGVASETKRDGAFAALTKAERLRVHGLIRGVKTVEHIIRAFGPPDRDSNELPDDLPVSMRTIPGTDSQQVGPLRQLTYEHLSDTAEVQFTIYSNGKVDRLITPKYIGPATEARDSPSPRD
jgi:hypothetical protein